MRLIAASLAFIMTMLQFTACGEVKEDVPELLDPIAVTESSRPAEIRDIGDVKVYKGFVVPESYPVFSERALTIAEIKVDIGDYVNEGDEIAIGDTSMYDEEIASLSRDLDFLYFRRESTIDISAKLVENLTYEQDREIYGNDYAAVLDYSNKIYNEQENDRYGVAVIDAEIANTLDRIAELRRLRDKLIFVAPHSGYVTFIKDFSTTNAIAPSENIAVVSDYDDLYIEASDLYTKNMKENTYVEMYTMQDGKKIPIEQYEFTPKELSLAEALKSYPNVRFRCNGLRLQIGATVPLYFKRKSENGVLAIGQDSVFYEGDTVYCYVFDNDGQKERRDIIIGMTDRYYVEVKSGLKEGEMVYYENQAVMPVKYSEYEVVTEDYVEEYATNMIGQFMSKYDIYIADCDGMLTKANVHTGEDVTEEQELYTIKSAVGKGDIAEVNNQIIDNNKKHTDAINDINHSEEEVSAALEAARVAPAPVASDTDAVKESLYRVENLEANLYLVNEYRQLEEYSYAYTNTLLQNRLYKLSIGSDTDGVITTTAVKAGRVGTASLKEDTTIRKGQYLFTVNRYGEKKIVKVGMPSKDDVGVLPAAKLGQDIVYREGDTTYTGKCIGMNGNAQKYFVFTRDGTEHLTYSAPYSGSSETFFAEMDNDKIVDDDMKGEITFKGSVIKGGTTIPARALYSEAAGVSEKKYYVWRITDAGLSKTYVNVYSATRVSDKFLILSGLNVGDKIAVGE